MATIYITRQGATLRKTGERLKVTIQRETLADVPLIKVSQIVIFGKASITASTLAELLDKQIEVCYLTQKGKYIGRVQPEFSKNSLLRIAQYKASVDPKQALALAKSCVIGNLSNMRSIIMRAARDRKLASCKNAAKRIQRAMTKTRNASNMDQVRGHEGDGSAAYFSVFNELITNKKFTFEKRVRRPPTDPVNALLSFGYTLLLNALYAAVNIVGFDPYIGYLHADKYGRPSLPLDLMEEFRPVIVDMVVLTCLNHKMLNLKDFSKKEGNVYRLNDKGRQVFLKQYEERKMSEFQHPILKQKMTYHHCFEQQARFFAKTLQGELPEYTPLRIK
jgi:CRISPR-associated protein Cas1